MNIGTLISGTCKKSNKKKQKKNICCQLLFGKGARNTQWGDNVFLDTGK